MAEVIKKRDSSSILLPLTLMNLLNAVLWTVYGIATRDPYVFVPNGIGGLLSLAQVALSLFYPAKASSTSRSLGA
jgi:solute carrier family 50 protein (sugar transporter)